MRSSCVAMSECPEASSNVAAIPGKQWCLQLVHAAAASVVAAGAAERLGRQQCMAGLLCRVEALFTPLVHASAVVD
jgi:hypothetical protein